MDTKFWGPGGWKLLHAISFGFPDRYTNKSIDIYRRFYETIQYILPCETCRNNYKDHIKIHPISYITSKDTCKLWLYNIHNSASDIIRHENRNIGYNPEFELIKDKYDVLCKKKICKNSQVWDFMYSVAYMFRGDMSQERYNGYILFYELLYEVMPFTLMKTLYKEHIKRHPINDNITNYRTLTKWIYEYEKLVYQSLNKNIISYDERLFTIENYETLCRGKDLKLCRKTLIITK